MPAAPAPAEAQTAPAVVGLTLVDARTDRDLGPLVDGQSVAPTTCLNVRATTSPPTVGSVRFVRAGANAATTTENVAPYAMAGDTSGDYSCWNAAAGSYTLAVTAYTAANAGGTAGPALTVRFAAGSVPPSATPTSTATSTAMPTSTATPVATATATPGPTCATPSGATAGAVQAAVNAAPTGGTVCLAATTYDFSAGSVRLKPGVTVRGQGAATIVRAGAGGTAISGTNASGAAVRDMRLVGTRSGEWATGIYLDGGSGQVISGVTVDGFGGDDLPSAHGIHVRNATRVTIEGSTVVRNGGAGVQFWKVGASRIERVTATDNGRHGIQVMGQSDGVSILRNVLSGNGRVGGTGAGRMGRSGLMLNDDGVGFPRTAHIEGNTVTQSGDHAIALFDWRYESPSTTTELIRIVDNDAVDNRNWADGSAGLIVEGLGNAVVERNRSHRNRFGIHAWNTGPGVVFAGNEARDNLWGAYAAGMHGGELRGNVLANGAETTGWGFECRAADGAAAPPSRGVTVTGNTIRNGARAGVLRAGACVGLTATNNRLSAPLQDGGGNTLSGNVVE